MLHTFHVAVSKHLTIPLVFLTLFCFNIMISVVKLFLCPMESHQLLTVSDKWGAMCASTLWSGIILTLAKQSVRHLCCKGKWQWIGTVCMCLLKVNKGWLDHSVPYWAVKIHTSSFVQVVDWMTCYNYWHWELRLCCTSSYCRCCDALECLDRWFVQTGSVWLSKQLLSVQNKVCVT